MQQGAVKSNQTISSIQAAHASEESHTGIVGLLLSWIDVSQWQYNVRKRDALTIKQLF